MKKDLIDKRLIRIFIAFAGCIGLTSINIPNSVGGLRKLKQVPHSAIVELVTLSQLDIGTFDEGKPYQIITRKCSRYRNITIDLCEHNKRRVP